MKHQLWIICYPLTWHERANTYIYLKKTKTHMRLSCRLHWPKTTQACGLRLHCLLHITKRLQLHHSFHCAPVKTIPTKPAIKTRPPSCYVIIQPPSNPQHYYTSLLRTSNESVPWPLLLHLMLPTIVYSATISNAASQRRPGFSNVWTKVELYSNLYNKMPPCGSRRVVRINNTRAYLSTSGLIYMLPHGPLLHIYYIYHEKYPCTRPI